jgi:hypothetical protein
LGDWDFTWSCERKKTKEGKRLYTEDTEKKESTGDTEKPKSGHGVPCPYEREPGSGKDADDGGGH